MININSYYYKAGKKLCTHYPDLVKQLIGNLDQGQISFEMISKTYEEFKILEGPSITKRARTKQNMEFVLIATLKYDPEALKSRSQPMRAGLRPILSKLLNCDPSNVSNLLKMGKDFMQTYPSFEKEIRVKFSELFLKKPGVKVQLN